MKKKILVADDDAITRLFAEKILKEADYEVTLTKDGAEAFDAISSNDFVAALIDIKMPTVSGEDLVTLIRDKTKNKTPLIYITVIPKDEVDISIVDGFIQKPFTRTTLIEGIEETIKNFKR
jgi:CheY-like chemotaxis protein